MYESISIYLYTCIHLCMMKSDADLQSFKLLCTMKLDADCYLQERSPTHTHTPTQCRHTHAHAHERRRAVMLTACMHTESACMRTL